MQLLFFLCVFFGFAGRVFGLNIVLTSGNLTAAQFLQVPGTFEQCLTQCNSTQIAIETCGSSDVCACGMGLVTSIVSCEQCIFTTMIERNEKGDARLGSTTALAAYQAACLASANVSIPASAIALSLPAGWDGPKNMKVGLGVTVATIGAGLVVMVGGIFVVNSM